MTRERIKCYVSGTVLGVLLCVLIANWATTKTSAQAQASNANAPEISAFDLNSPLVLSSHKFLPAGNVGATQGAQEDKPVEQTRKNIQVLKGLPESQLFPLMNFVRVSLGVNCEFCHVHTGDNWDWASDAKDEKKTGREMMQMVLSVNKSNFGGNNAITCYTCHRGNEHVTGIPPLPQPWPKEEEKKDEKAANANVPTAEQLFDKYLQAVGGRAAIDAIKTRAMKGTVVMANNVSIPYEAYQSAPNKVYAVMHTPKQGDIQHGYNGTVGWMQGPRGTRQLPSWQLAQLKQEADPANDYVFKENYTRLRLIGKDKINDHEAYYVRAVNKNGNGERLYFDTQTGLLLRRVIIERTVLLPIPHETNYDDYRDVSGLKMPFAVTEYNIDNTQSSVLKFTEIKLNVPVDDAKFNMPQK
ncbi:MAG: c-type cytochrome [Pyrinomonadaceae bacterium]